MQHDMRLRDDARYLYEKGKLWVDQPPFEEAERLGLERYRVAVVVAQDDRALHEELNSRAMQLRMF